MNRLTFISFALLTCLCGFAQSEVYRSVDESGNIIFSDVPQSGSTKVDLPELSTYESPPSKEIKRDKPSGQGLDPAQDFVSYSDFTILQPIDKDTFRDNSGAVPVELQITPALQVTLGHQVILLLDGKKIISTTVPKYKLTGIERGAHTLSAQILDKDGKVLKASNPVSFQLLRFSKLFKNSQPQPPQKSAPLFSPGYAPDYSPR